MATRPTSLTSAVAPPEWTGGSGSLLTPLRSFLDVHFRSRLSRLQKQIDDEELRRFDLEERVIEPIHGLLQALPDQGGERS